MHKPTLHSHTHCQAAQGNAQTKACKRASSFAPEREFQKFFSLSLKNNKRNAQPDIDRQKSKRTMTLKLNTDNGLQRRADRTPADYSRNCCTTIFKKHNKIKNLLTSN